MAFTNNVFISLQIILQAGLATHYVDIVDLEEAVMGWVLRLLVMLLYGHSCTILQRIT